MPYRIIKNKLYMINDDNSLTQIPDMKFKTDITKELRKHVENDVKEKIKKDKEKKDKEHKEVKPKTFIILEDTPKAKTKKGRKPKTFKSKDV